MKRTIALFLVCLLAFALPVSAAEAYVVDEAELLLPDEISELEQTVAQIRADYGFDIVLVTMDSIDGADPWQWANHYYDTNGYADDGMMFLLVMDTREWAISTCGSGIGLFTESDQDYMIDQIIDYLSGGDYYSAFDWWLTLCVQELDIGMDTDFDPVVDPDYSYDDDYGYDYDYGYESSPNYILRFVAAVAIGFLGSMIPMGILKGQIRNVRAKSGAEDYTRPGSMHLTHRADRFLYTHTSRVRRAQNNSSGGHSGGGSHSGGGRSHGGSRGRF